MKSAKIYLIAIIALSGFCTVLWIPSTLNMAIQCFIVMGIFWAGMLAPMLIKKGKGYA